jgi:hypothetical protein
MRREGLRRGQAMGGVAFVLFLVAIFAFEHLEARCRT